MTSTLGCCATSKTGLVDSEQALGINYFLFPKSRHCVNCRVSSHSFFSQGNDTTYNFEYFPGYWRQQLTYFLPQLSQSFHLENNWRETQVFRYSFTQGITQCRRD